MPSAATTITAPRKMSRVNGRTGYKYLTGVTRPLTRERLRSRTCASCRGCRSPGSSTLENTRFFLVHATPRDPLDEFAPPDVEFWSRRLQHVDADVICVGHTHQPYVLEVGDKLVINPGSVGLSRDGDPRASYAVIENYKVDLKKIEYPVEDAAAVVRASALPEAAKDMLIEIARTAPRPTAGRRRT